MKNNTSSLPEKVFQLVKSLTKTERGRIVSFIQATPKGQKSYFKLFNLYSSRSSSNVNDAEKAFGGDRTSFKVANRYLRKILLEALVVDTSEKLNTLDLARKAVEKGFPKYAKQLLEGVISKSMEEENRGDLIELFDELELIERHYLGEKSSPTRTRLESLYFSDLSVYSQCKVMYEALKSTLGKGGEEMEKAYEKHKDILESFSTGIYYPRTEYLLLKTTQLHLSIGSKFTQAASLQPRVLKIISDFSSLFPIEKRINEVNTQVSFLINGGEYTEARQLLTDLASEEYPAHLEELISKTWVLYSIYLAAISGDIEYLPRAEKDFNKYEHLLSTHQRVRLSHAIGILHFHKGEWEMALNWQNRVLSKSTREKMGIEWLPFLVRAICQFEQGYFYRAKVTIGKFQSSTLNQRYRYPSLVLEHLLGVINAEENRIGKQFLWEQLKESYCSEVDGNVEFQAEERVFSLSYWIDSKVNKKHIRELFLECQQPGTPLFLLG